MAACSSSPTAPIVRDGAYVDSLMLVALDTRVAAFERAGTYRVEVRLTGYQNFTASGVRVTAGTCHVNAVGVSALLRCGRAPEPRAGHRTRRCFT